MIDEPVYFEVVLTWKQGKMEKWAALVKERPIAFGRTKEELKENVNKLPGNYVEMTEEFGNFI